MTTNASVKFLNEPGLCYGELIEAARFDDHDDVGPITGIPK